MQCGVVAFSFFDVSNSLLGRSRNQSIRTHIVDFFEFEQSSESINIAFVEKLFAEFTYIVYSPILINPAKALFTTNICTHIN